MPLDSPRPLSGWWSRCPQTCWPPSSRYSACGRWALRPAPGLQPCALVSVGAKQLPGATCFSLQQRLKWPGVHHCMSALPAATISPPLPLLCTGGQ